MDSQITSAYYEIVRLPWFNPNPGTYTAAVEVALGTGTAEATIRYSTDGTTPTSVYGTVYSGPVSISAPTVLKVMAYRFGWTDSAVCTEEYIITPFKSGALTYDVIGRSLAVINCDTDATGEIIIPDEIAGFPEMLKLPAAVFSKIAPLLL